MKEKMSISFLYLICFCSAYLVGCGNVRPSDTTTATTTESSVTSAFSQITESTAEPIVATETTIVQARELLTQDITYVYDEDIKTLLNHEFTINDNEDQPYVTFYCSNNGVAVEAEFTCFLPASSDDKDFEKTWKYKFNYGSRKSGDGTGQVSFMTGNDATYYGQPYGNYIVYSSAFLKVTKISYTGYEDILQ